MSVFKWGSSSLWGHIVLFEIFLGVPMFVMALDLLARQGTLTASWILWAVFLDTNITALLAIIMWYTITKPLIRRRDGNP